VRLGLWAGEAEGRAGKRPEAAKVGEGGGWEVRAGKHMLSLTSNIPFIRPPPFVCTDHLRILAELQRLAGVLLSTPVPPHRGFLMVPHDMGDFVPPALRQSVYMRYHYHVALRTILAQQAPALFVVTGTPGIGKSAFALPLVCSLAKNRERVLYIHKFGHFGTAMILLDFTNPNDLKVDYATELHGLERMAGEQLAPSLVESLGAWLDCVSGSRVTLLSFIRCCFQMWHRASSGR
jgi:hypothetical protein